MTVIVRLREEDDGIDQRYLDAYFSEGGDLVISGQDLGPGTAIVSPGGEYEWEHKIAREHVPAFTRLLGAAPGSDILDELVANWSGPKAHDLEQLIHKCDLPIETWTHAG